MKNLMKIHYLKELLEDEIVDDELELFIDEELVLSSLEFEDELFSLDESIKDDEFSKELELLEELVLEEVLFSLLEEVPLVDSLLLEELDEELLLDDGLILIYG